MVESSKVLTKAINEVIRLLEKREKNGSLRAEEMRRALQSSHEAIKLMLTDDELFAQLVYPGTDNDEIVSKLTIFNKRFISAEYTALKNAGVSYAAKDALIRQTRNRRTTISLSEDYRTNLRGYLEETRETINALLEKLEPSGNTLEGKKSVQKDWRIIAYLIGGVVLVGINSSTTIPALFAILGMEIIKESIRKIVS
jgi:hypothetical protein